MTEMQILILCLLLCKLYLLTLVPQSFQCIKILFTRNVILERHRACQITLTATGRGWEWFWTLSKAFANAVYGNEC